MARLNREMMSSPTKVGEVTRAKRGSEGERTRRLRTPQPRRGPKELPKSGRVCHMPSR
jgi:hypothetical protein